MSTPIGSAGSGEVVRDLAAGLGIGLADPSTLIAFAGTNQKVTPKIILPIFDKVPACVISFKKKPVKTVADLKNVKIGMGLRRGRQALPGPDGPQQHGS